MYTFQCLPEYQAQLDQEKRGKFVSSSKSSCLFSFHDVIETSYHFVAQKINLHLSDDPGSKICFVRIVIEVYYKLQLIKL